MTGYPRLCDYLVFCDGPGFRDRERGYKVLCNKVRLKSCVVCVFLKWSVIMAQRPVKSFAQQAFIIVPKMVKRQVSILKVVLFSIVVSLSPLCQARTVE